MNRADIVRCDSALRSHVCTQVIAVTIKAWTCSRPLFLVNSDKKKEIHTLHVFCAVKSTFYGFFILPFCPFCVTVLQPAPSLHAEPCDSLHLALTPRPSPPPPPPLLSCHCQLLSCSDWRMIGHCFPLYQEPLCSALSLHFMWHSINRPQAYCHQAPWVCSVMPPPPPSCRTMWESHAVVTTGIHTYGVWRVTEGKVQVWLMTFKLTLFNFVVLTFIKYHTLHCGIEK